MRKIGRLFVYVCVFLKELVVANIQIAKIILSPRMNFQSAAVRFHSKMKTKAELILITNSITLTPGTLVMDATLEKGEILVHAMTGNNLDEIKQSIRAFPEEKALRALRGKDHG